MRINDVQLGIIAEGQRSDRVGRGDLPRAGRSAVRRASTVTLAAVALLLGLGLPAVSSSQERATRGAEKSPPQTKAVARSSSSSSKATRSSTSTRPVRVTRSSGSVRDGDVRRSVRSRYHRRPYRYHSLHFGYPWGWGWGYGGWGWYGFPTYGYGPYAQPPVRGVDYWSRDWGALDLDIKPEEAQIYLDGSLIGIADNYDGFPRYLWLERGSYDLVIYKEGYETLGRRIEVRPGGVLRMKDEMVRGESKSPEEMYAQLAPKREEARKRQEAPKHQEVEPRRQRRELAPWRYRDDGEDRRVRPGRPQAGGEETWRERPAPRRAGGGTASGGGAGIDNDLRTESAELRLTVTPADAAVYLDGRLVGSGAQIAELEEPLLVDPGSHVLQVSRPGYVDAEVEVEVAAGETETVTVELEEN